MEYQAIILAAGNSSRSGLSYNKVLFEINGGRKIIEVSIKNFLIDNDCSKVVLVSKENEKKTFQDLFKDESKIVYVTGGNTRQESVKNALDKIGADYVFIHDGARPYYTSILLNRMKEKLKTANAVIPVWTPRDTMVVIKDGFVKSTLKREDLRSVQTPQAFKTNLIKKAHEEASHCNYTDDSSMVIDILKESVATIDGEYSNTKFTFKEDF